MVFGVHLLELETTRMMVEMFVECGFHLALTSISQEICGGQGVSIYKTLWTPLLSNQK